MWSQITWVSLSDQGGHFKPLGLPDYSEFLQLCMRHIVLQPQHPPVDSVPPCPTFILCKVCLAAHLLLRQKTIHVLHGCNKSQCLYFAAKWTLEGRKALFQTCQKKANVYQINKNKRTKEKTSISQDNVEQIPTWHVWKDIGLTYSFQPLSALC